MLGCDRWRTAATTATAAISEPAARIGHAACPRRMTSQPPV
jgi:hypothetical protein